MSDLLCIEKDTNIPRADLPVRVYCHKAENRAPKQQYLCRLWADCRNAYCFKHGCLSVLRQQSKEVRS